jgi:LysM domain
MPLEDDLQSQQQIAGSKAAGNPLASLGNKKWWVIGGLALLIIILLLKGKSSAKGSSSGGASQPGSQGTEGNIDPATGYAFGSSADVAALRTYGALGGGGRYNMGAYPRARGGSGGVSSIGLGGSVLPPYEPVNQAFLNGLPEPQFPVGPAGPPGPGNSGATGLNTAEITTSSQALTTQPTVPIDSKSANHTRVYRVKPGDNLAGIAAKFGVAGGYTTLYKLNQHSIGPNPDMLIPGTLIYL